MQDTPTPYGFAVNRRTYDILRDVACVSPNVQPDAAFHFGSTHIELVEDQEDNSMPFDTREELQAYVEFCKPQ